MRIKIPLKKKKKRIKIQELPDVIWITTRQLKVVQQRLFRNCPTKLLFFNKEKGQKSYYSLLN